MISRDSLFKEIAGIQEIEFLDTFRYFEDRLSHILETYLYQLPPKDLLSIEEKQLIFSLLWYVRSPKRAPENTISNSELKDLNEKYQQIIRTFRVKYEGGEISLLDYNILAAFYHVLYHGIKNRKRAGELKEAFAVPILEGVSMMKAIPNMYTACFSILISRLNDVRKKYYSFEMLRSDGQGNLDMTLTPVLSIYWAKQESMMIHRTFRSVFKVPNPYFYSGISWLTMHIEKLNSHYSGNKKELNLYIQSHALNQMQKYLDIFDQHALNDILSFNLRHIEDLQHYKGNLLLPIHVYQIKVGYLICDVIDDNLVARTFLSIMNNNTPEGDSFLDEHTYSKADIIHCQSDKLSSLFKVEDEVSFKAGFEDLFRLKDYKLKINAMQEANYKEFLSYIKQGEEAELSVASVNQEDLTLQDSSLGKLLGLLILNTLGLIVAQVMKFFYSLANKLKRLAKQNTDLNGELEKQKTNDLSNAELIMRNEIDVTLSTSKNYKEQVS